MTLTTEQGLVDVPPLGARQAHLAHGGGLCV